MYLTKISVYPGCDQHDISPAAVGAIIAFVIMGIGLFGGFALWSTRKCLFRDPFRGIVQREDSLTLVNSIDQAKLKEKGIDYSSRSSTSNTNWSTNKSPGTDPEKLQIPVKAAKKQGRGPMGKLMARSSERLKADCVIEVIPDTSRWHKHKSPDLETAQASSNGSGGGSRQRYYEQPRVIDFAGITVTREVEIITEKHGEREIDRRLSNTDSEESVGSTGSTRVSTDEIVVVGQRALPPIQIQAHVQTGKEGGNLKSVPLLVVRKALKRENGVECTPSEDGEGFDEMGRSLTV